jgi:hypothetical protein
MSQSHSIMFSTTNWAMAMNRSVAPYSLVLLVLITVMSFGNLGCGTRHDVDRFGSVKHGMAIETVERLLGQPASRVVDGNIQTFVYAVGEMNQPPGDPNLRVEGYYVVFTNGYVQSCGLGYRKR